MAYPHAARRKTLRRLEKDQESNHKKLADMMRKERKKARKDKMLAKELDRRQRESKGFSPDQTDLMQQKMNNMQWKINDLEWKNRYGR